MHLPLWIIESNMLLSWFRSRVERSLRISCFLVHFRRRGTTFFGFICVRLNILNSNIIHQTFRFTMINSTWHMSRENNRPTGYKVGPVLMFFFYFFFHLNNNFFFVHEEEREIKKRLLRNRRFFILRIEKLNASIVFKNRE